MPKLIFTIFSLFLFFILSSSAYAGIDQKLNNIIEFVAAYNLQDQIDYGQDGIKLGEEICKAGGGLSCYGSSIGEGICRASGGLSCHGSSIGEGICRAGGGLSCFGSSIGEGICRAGGGLSCYGSSTGEGICRARRGMSCYGMSIEQALQLPVVDTEWKWDMFRSPNSYENQWACRGTASGRFADESNCFGQIKIDDTWPNN